MVMLVVHRHTKWCFRGCSACCWFLKQLCRENNALILPGRVPSFRDQSLKLLPSWETKAAMHDLYAKSCPGDVKPVSRRSFVRIWKKTVPHIIIQMTHSDLCLTCQQNTTSMADLANMSDKVKTDRIKNSLEHLNLGQRERLHYTDTIQKCKLSEWVSSFLTAHQHIIGHSVP